MKLITAILWPDCLAAVHDALDPSEAYVLSAAQVVDAAFTSELYRGAEFRQPRLRSRIEIVVLNDLAAPDVIGALEREAAELGEKNCSLVLTSLVDAVRLRRS
jgi:nitrogen regulatory protein PII